MNPILKPSLTELPTCANLDARARLRESLSTVQGGVRSGGISNSISRVKGFGLIRFRSTAGLLLVTASSAFSAFVSTSGIGMGQFAPDSLLNAYSVYGADTVSFGDNFSSASGGYFGSGLGVKLGAGADMKSPLFSAGRNFELGGNTKDSSYRLLVNGNFTLTSGTVIDSIVQVGGQISTSGNPVRFKKAVYTTNLTTNGTTIFNAAVNVTGNYTLGGGDQYIGAPLNMGAGATFTPALPTYSNAPDPTNTGVAITRPYPAGALIRTDTQLPGYTINGVINPGTVPDIDASIDNPARYKMVTLSNTATGDAPNQKIANCAVLLGADAASACRGDTLVPGYYNNLKLGANGTALLLGEGVYSFYSIDMQAGGRLLAAQPNGARTVVYVYTNFTSSASNNLIAPVGGVNATGYGTGSGQFLGGTMMLIGNGDVTISSDLNVWATLSAPHGTMQFGTQLHLYGQAFAKRILGPNTQFGQGAYIRFDPFKPIIQINRGSSITIREGTTAPCVSCKDTTIYVSLSKKNAFEVTLQWELLSNDGGPLQDAVWGVDFTTPGVSNNFTPLGPQSGTLTIKANELSDSLKIRIKDDAIYTFDRNFRIRLFEPKNARFDTTGGGDSIQDVTPVKIIDDDPPGMFSFVKLRETVGENAGRVSIGVRYSDPRADTIWVNVATVPAQSSAIAGQDYQYPTVRLPFPPGAGPLTINFDSLRILVDNRDEPVDSLRLILTNQSAGGIQSDSGAMTILITDDDPTPAIRIEDVVVKELEAAGSDTTARFVVRLVDASTGTPLAASDFSEWPTQYRWYTEDSTATVADGDYLQVLRTLRTFPAGTVVDTVKVTVRTNNRHYEGTEYFKVKVDSFVNLAGARPDSIAVGTIQEYDSPPAFRIAGDSVVEPDLSVRDSIPFVVTLVRPYSGTLYSADTTFASRLPTYYSWYSRDQSARAGLDYDTALVTKSRIIPPGRYTDTFYVHVIGDNRYEGRETFLIKIVPGLNSFVNAPAQIDSAQGVILDDEPRPGLCVADSFVTEGDPPANATMRVRAFLGDSASCAPLTALQAPEVPVGFSWGTADSSALQPQDYTQVSGQADTIAANTLSKLLPITVKGDSIYEGDEYLKVQLSPSVSNGILARAQATGMIEDDDRRPTISVSALDSMEGNTGTKIYRFVATMSAVSTSNVVFDWRTNDLGRADTSAAKAGEDYNAQSTTRVTILAGSTSTMLSVTVNGDTKYEKDEVFQVEIIPYTGLSDTGNTLTAIGTILNDDVEPTISSIIGVSALEGHTGTKNFTFRVNLSSASGLASRFTWSTQGDTGLSGAKATEDFVNVPSTTTVVIPPDSSYALINVSVKGDTKYEMDESFRVIATSGAGLTASVDTGTGVILNDDSEPQVRILDAADVGEPLANRDSANASFQIVLSARTGVPVTVTWATADSSASATQPDYRSRGTMVTFAQDVDSIITVTVPVLGDSLDEVEEFFKAIISGATNATRMRDVALAKILDTDPAPGIHVDPVSVTEPATAGTPITATVRVWIDSVSGQDVSFRWSTRNGTATFGTGDYDSTGESVRTIPAGQTFVNLSVTARGDSVANEGTESLRVALSNVVNASGTDTSDIVSIVDATPLPVLTIASSDTVDEADVNVPFTITLSSPSATAIDVLVKTYAISATSGADYRKDSSWITITAGSRTYTGYTARVYEDNRYETNIETFEVRLDAASAGVTNPAGAVKATVGIDDDEAVPTLSIDNVTTTELANAGASTPAVFTVTLSGPSELAITVDWTTDSARSATDPATSLLDYTAGSNSLTFASDVVTRTISIPVLGDSLDENAETYLVRLSNATVATIAKDTGIGVINDNDNAPAIHVDSLPIDEPTSPTGSVTGNVRIWLDRVSGLPVSFRWSTRNGTATFGSGDYDSAGAATQTIPAGTRSITVPVVVHGDSVANEGTEKFRIALSSLVNASGTDTTDTVYIADKTAPPTLSISPSDTTVAEDSVNVPFRITLSSPSATNIRVLVKTYAGTATSDADYRKDSIWITIPAGSRSYTGYSARVYEDNRYETNIETFEVRLDSAGPGVTDPNGLVVATVGIDDDEAVPTLTIGNVTTPEPTDAGTSTPAVFTVTLSGPSELDVTVDWTTDSARSAANPASSSLDYTSGSSQLLFTADVVSRTISVSVLGDSLDEYDETYLVRLSNPTVATLSSKDTSVGVITDTDSMPTLSVIDPGTIAEGGTANFIARLERPSAKDVILVWSTRDSTAIQDSDYVPVVFRRDTIAAFESSIQLPVVTKADAVAGEPIEVFLLKIDSLENAGVGDTLGRALIADATGTPTISIDSVGDFTEPGSDSSVVFHVKLSMVSALPVTVTFQTLSRLATVGADLDDTTGVLTFAPGTTSLDLPIRIIADAFHELVREDFSVNLSGATNAGILQPIGTGAILDNDAAPTISVYDDSILEPAVAGAVDSAVVVVRLSAPSNLLTSVVLNTDDATALSPGDYVKSGRTLEFAPGVTQITFLAAVLGDSLDEVDEWFVANLSSPVNGVLGDSAGRVLIQDNDSAPTLSVATVSANEGDTALVTITIDRKSAMDVVFDWETVQGTATGDLDYKTLSGTDTLKVGATSLVLRIPVYADSIANELNETFRILITRVVNAALPDSDGVVTIVDQTPVPTISIDSVGAFFEPDLDSQVVFHVKLSSPSAIAVNVSYGTVSGTAVAGSDFTATTGVLTFPAGTTSLTIPVTILADTIHEDSSEIFTVELSAPVGATVAQAVGLGEILDDDAPPTISVFDTSITEPAMAGAFDSASIVVRLSAPSSLQTTVVLNTSDSTALSPEDYRKSGATVVFAPGEVVKIFRTAVVGDSLDEVDEWFLAKLSSPSNAVLGDSAGRVLIADNDTAPVLSIASVSANEGDTALVTVTLERVSAKDIVFDWSTIEGSALGNIDYKTVSGTDTIKAGGTSLVLRVPVFADSIANELNETFRILVTRVVNAMLPDSDAVVTIIDQTAKPRISVLAAGNVVEDPVYLAFPIVLDHPSSVPVRVSWKTQEGTAKAGLDFKDSSNTVLFAPGTVRDTIRVRVLEDAIYEPWIESLLVVLSQPESASIAIDRAPGGIIDDNDAPSISIDSAAPVVEGGTALFPVRMNGISADSVVVWWHTIDSSAKAPADYNTSSGRLVFKPGETSLNVSVVTLVDSIWEPTEHFFVRIDSVRGGFIADSSEAGRRGKVSLLEEGAYPTVSFDMRDTSVWERSAGKVPVKVKLSRAASVPLEVLVQVDSASVAIRGTDYSLLGLHGDTLAIPSLSRIVSFQVNVIDDSLDEIDELVRMALKNLGSLAPLGKSSFDLTILDDDSAPAISFDVDTQTVDEDVGVVVVTAKLTRASAKPIDVWYSIEGGTATPGVDHDLKPFHLHFDPGATTTTIRFNVIDDRIDENNETVVVDLDSARNGNLKQPTRQIVVIRDNDNAPTARFVDTLKVVRENVGTVNFPIRLSHPSAQAIVLKIAVRGSAILDSLRKGSDVVLDSDVVYEVRIPAGDTTASFSIRVIDDGRVESTEDVRMTMTGGTAADQKFKANSRLEILDNDKNPDVKITRPADSLRTKSPEQTISWTWDDKPQADKDTTLVEGWNTIRRCATDTAGNTGCDTVHVWGDFTPPRVVITKPDSIYLTNNPKVRVCWTVIDSGATWRRVDSTRCMDTTLTEGTHVVPREACDSVGNCGRDQVIVTVDLTAPKGVFLYPPDSSRVRVVNLPARIRWIDDKDTIYVNDTLQMTHYGWNTFSATYTDKAGNVGKTSVTVYYEAPKVESGYYLDTDGDGRVDAVVVDFDSPWESDTLPEFTFDLGSESRTVEVEKVDWKKTGTIGVPALDSKGKVVVEYGDTVYLAPGTVMLDKKGKVILDSVTGKPITSPVGQVYRDATGKVVYDAEGRQMYRVPSPSTTAKTVPAKDDKGKVVVVNGDTVFLAPGIVKTDMDGKTIIDSETGKPATVAVGDVYRDASGKIVYDADGRQMYIVPNPSTADRTSMIVHLDNPFKYGVTSLSSGDSGTMKVTFSVVDSSGKPRATTFQSVFPLGDSVAPIIAKAVVVRTESYTGKDSVFLTPSEPLRFDSTGTWVEVKIDGKWHVVPAESLTVLKDGRIVILVEPGEDGSIRPGLEVRFGTGVSDSVGNKTNPSETKWATKVEGDPRPPLLELELPEAVKTVPASEKNVTRDGEFVVRATDKSQESGYQWWKPGYGYTTGSDPDIRNVCPDISFCTGIELYVNRPVRMFLFIYDLEGVFVIRKEINLTQKDIDGLRADKLDRVRIQIQWNMRGQNGKIVGSGIYLWRVVSYVQDPNSRKPYMTNEVVKIGVKSSLE